MTATYCNAMVDILSLARVGLNFLDHMGYVKRRANTKAKVNPSDFEAYKSQFLLDIKTVVEMEEIPKELVINWDHTGIQYMP